MMTHRTKTRRHLRSARVAALTTEERREEMRAAEAQRAARHDRSEPDAVDPPGPAGPETHQVPRRDAGSRSRHTDVMNGLIACDSYFGNTLRVAEALADSAQPGTTSPS